MRHRTRYAELALEKIGTDWRFIDTATGGPTGPPHPSQASIRADLDRQAANFGVGPLAGQDPTAAKLRGILDALSPIMPALRRGASLVLPAPMDDATRIQVYTTLGDVKAAVLAIDGALPQPKD